ncbi:poly-beta-hydroxybutyrate-responsive repressor [Ectobacillus sp. JY-23]|uniref:poly-beta-hydroxybutyrate-responsive repressor n=1 Tax=Ectobacillus sp. JY-23 TaxID=2933872 RepID=UPI001FF3FB23|nr:poly-beta-hydroxybutyrate-responsive repressor [Ectobacillus sp. JY-23]UOY92634.1 poly-beta-hydroxybutyrate-responsive repressor [Ectobacillus sp. JY-23]
MTNEQKIKDDGSSHAPKNFLVPFVLLCLKDWNMHGYRLIQTLIDMGFSTIDQGNVYRTLRKLEKENLISSTWDTSEGGPAKRIYSITEYGEQYLSACAGSFAHYQKMLGTFFNMYTNAFFPFTNIQDPNKTTQTTKPSHPAE